MSIRKLFERNKSFKVLSSASLSEEAVEVESERYIRAKIEDIQRFEPQIDFSTASNFVKYGSAERYYVDAVSRIFNEYPYDGALSEKQKYYNSSSYLDKYIFDKKYPRTYGYINLGSDGWGDLNGSITKGYGLSSTPEYITIKGGPHTASVGMIGKSFSSTFDNSNILDSSSKRYSNLHLDFYNGNTVEFWLKKDSWGYSKTNKEVVFDLWNGKDPTDEGYGRFRIEVSGGNGGAFTLTAISGAYDSRTGIDRTVLTGATTSSYATTSSLTSWHHYAFSLENSGSAIELKFYQDGKLLQTVGTGSTMGNVTGGLRARIGALYTSPSGTSLSNASNGWGKLSASLDEFRFWKTRRDSTQIGRNWWTQVNGGTNTDDANVDLGVYYKFNEGIVFDDAIDNVVLDYSGRISNGYWRGYPGSAKNYPTAVSARSTGSAIVISSASITEFKDPIIYQEHSDVKDVYNNLKDTGSYFDYTNNSSIINSLPQWIIEDEERNGQGDLGRLVQILASYFDSLHAQISAVPRLADVSYLSSSYKPIPFANELLETNGLVTSEILVDSNIIEKLLKRNDKFDFTRDLAEIKNLIYINIYNNLINIYKSKGTEKSFRNMIRCYGIDDELIKVRLYANNKTFEIENNYRNTYTKKNVVDFNDPDRFSSVVYQYPETGNSDSVGYISGSSDSNSSIILENHLPVTIEVDVVFPRKNEERDPGFFATDFVSSSIFGFHQAADDGANLSWQTPDSASVQIYAVRNEKESKHARFLLTASDQSLNATVSSSLYKNLYDGGKWTLALRLSPKDYPVQGRVSGSLTRNYALDLYGVQLYGDLVENEFSLTSSISHAAALKFLSAKKRLFAGAHRENITGTLQQSSDVRISGVRYWFSRLSDEEIKSHARDPRNFGTEHAGQSSYLLQSNLSEYYVPKAATLALNWDFAQVTSSDTSSDGSSTTSDAKFTVLDISSGSVDTDRYGWISTILNRQHTGRGDNFLPLKKNVVKTEYFFTNRLEPADVNVSSDTINIISGSDESFVRTSRPIDHFFTFEKSMYDIISDEMLKFFAGVVEFNNLIGEPVDRYRQEYKGLRPLREIFFQKMTNAPDLEKFMEYYKWIDQSLGIFLNQLVPANAKFSDGVLNLIESHVLERNKYQHKYPTLEMSFNDPETPILGINELLYNWKFNHHPVSGTIIGIEETGSNCQWWKQRVGRTEAGATSGDATIDSQRNEIELVLQTHHSRSAYALAQTDKSIYSSSTFVLRALSRPYRFGISEVKTIKGGINFEPSKKLSFVYINTLPHGPRSAGDAPLNVLSVGLEEFAVKNKIVPGGDCDDDIIPNLKNKQNADVIIGRTYDASGDYQDAVESSIGLPFNLYSSSVRTGYTKVVQRAFRNNTNIVNLHVDAYAPNNEVPMQGPFTEKYVGGHQSRHVDINRYDTTLLTDPVVGGATTNNLDDTYSRPEGWRILLGGGPAGDPGAIGIVGADYGGPYPDTTKLRATRYREEYAKRPVNIRNIQQTTGSGTPGITVIGNYTNMYEVISAAGRHVNSVQFVKNEGAKLPPLFEKTNHNLPQTTNVNTLFAVRDGGPKTSLANRGGNYFGRNNNNVGQASNRYDVSTKNVSTNYTASNFSSSNVIIANKFSAPGGPEIQSLGYLDIKSQELSVYNALPFRNLSVRGSGSGEALTIRANSPIGRREGLQTLLRRHCGRFGVDSEYGSVRADFYPTIPSFHKINRNVFRGVKITGSETQAGVVETFDNAYVQHMIPQSDFQYSWLTASLGTASLNPSEYTSGSFSGYIPKTGLVISGSTYVSAVNFPMISSISVVQT